MAEYEDWMTMWDTIISMIIGIPAGVAFIIMLFVFFFKFYPAKARRDRLREYMSRNPDTPFRDLTGGTWNEELKASDLVMARTNEFGQVL